MFIEVESDTNFVLEVYEEDAIGRIELRPDQIRVIKNSRFGHSQFMYQNGELIEHPDLTSEIIQGQKDRQEMEFNFPGVMLVIAKAFHKHENEIRALNSQPSVTLQQVIKGLRAL
jgi:hypothetical protein